ncbi:hypothetical protein BH10BAC1_BH10BAC1_10490 [soil metagenome]
MNKSIFTYSVIFFCFILSNVCSVFSQNVPQGFNYQVTVRDASGLSIINQSVSIRFSLYSNSPSGTLMWQEDHFTVTDNYGLVNEIIGAGISTGAGLSSSFSQVNWGSAFYYLKVSIDVSGGIAYTDMGTSQLFSVPYSLYSAKTSSSNALSLDQLNDVDLIGNAVEKILKWNGSNWIPALDNDSDTVLYAINSGHSIYSDTAFYVYGLLSIDTLLFAYQNDSSVFSINSLNTISTSSSAASDTATYAFSSAAFAWKSTGNLLTSSANYLGTNDNSSINFISNNLVRATVTGSGNLSINNSLASSKLALMGNDGFLVTGAAYSSISAVSGAGAKMFYYPAKGAFRAGYIDSNQWDTSNVGYYSFASGYNNKANAGSISSGAENVSIDYSITFGRKCKAMGVGLYPGGNSIAMGDSCVSSFQRAVAIGKNNVASNGADIAIGYGNNASGGTSVALGTLCISPGVRSTAIGFYAAAMHTGSFVYSDASSSTPTLSTANHQFSVRASGGIVFYTDSLNTMGVALFPGSGSWASISDVNKKENFSAVDCELLLKGIEGLKIQSWNYKSQPQLIRHVGPMSQDFYKIFNVGENNITISSIDVDGVILSGIRGLNNRLLNLQSINEIDELNQRILILSNSAELNSRLDVIEAAINKK